MDVLVKLNLLLLHNHENLKELSSPSAFTTMYKRSKKLEDLLMQCLHFCSKTIKADSIISCFSCNILKKKNLFFETMFICPDTTKSIMLKVS